jgi:uncharacterized protein involved in exopolysaccharide biosynthesis
MTHTETPLNTDFQDDSIDVVAILKTLWKGRLTLIICTVLGIGVGLLVAFSTPNQYTARTVLVPQVKSSAKSSLSSLASLAGVDLGMSESADLSPILYPQIVGSIPFKLELMHTPVHFQDCDSAISVLDYYTLDRKPTLLSTAAKYTIGLPGVIMGAIRPKPKETAPPKQMLKGPINLTADELAIKKILDAQVSLEVEKKEGYLTLTVTMEDPIVAAELAEKAQQMLQQFITDFKVEKSRAELNFIQERFNIAKSQAEGYQYGMASNLDRYKDLTSNIPEVSNSRLQSKYTIANSVYMELAKQLEQAKIQVKRDTPVFTVVEPVSIPKEKSNSGRIKILILFMMVGCVGGVALLYLKKWLHELKLKWADTQA